MNTMKKGSFSSPAGNERSLHPTDRHMTQRRALWSEAYPYLRASWQLAKIAQDNCHPTLYVQRH